MEQKTNQFGVQPGPCPVVDGLPICPSPTEIDIIKVNKVFEEYMNTQVEEVAIEFEMENQSDLTPQFVSVNVLEQECTILSNSLVRLIAVLEVKSKLDDIVESEELIIDKIYKLNRAGEENLNVRFHIFPECLLCFVSDVEEDEEEIFVNVTCCIGILSLIKVEAEVQLLVPTYGYSPLPNKCQLLTGECPEFIPNWPPYPS